MAYTYLNSKGKLSVNTWECFKAAVEDINLFDCAISDILQRAEDTARSEGPDITTAAFANARGSWYEWVVALGAIRWMREHPESLTMCNLPNVSSYDCSRLYDAKISFYIDDLRKKARESSNVELISSNPDFVLVSSQLGRDLPTREQIAASTSSDIINGIYQQFHQRCDLDDLLGYASVKTSFRPDRRLQIPHEGSLFKALYRHIQTRDWLVDAPGISYYAVTQKANDKDFRALNTVATHSITDVSSKPLAAVDELFVVTDGLSLTQMLESVLGGS